MKISLTELIEGQKEVLDVEAEEHIEGLNYLGDEVSIIGPMSLKGKIYREDTSLYLDATVEIEAEFICNRCLEKFRRKIVSNVHEELLEEDSGEIDDVYVIRKKMIDVSDIIKNTLILCLPMKIICDESCKGLCLVCGGNLNEEQCDCEKEEIDPRLAKLKHLLQ
ncbi:DUF177 domain-containing protein [Lutibacter sp. B2]|nr:DUF177 domain-containing protein [Lutibacter sp. B2]